jgi:hypothetical protein
VPAAKKVILRMARNATYCDLPTFDGLLPSRFDLDQFQYLISSLKKKASVLAV